MTAVSCHEMKRMTEPKPCPWCKHPPLVEPADPTREGSAWGQVRCVNDRCPAQPSVRDGEDVADERGPSTYKEAAIRRWNSWG